MGKKRDIDHLYAEKLGYQAVPQLVQQHAEEEQQHERHHEANTLEPIGAAVLEADVHRPRHHQQEREVDADRDAVDPENPQRPRHNVPRSRGVRSFIVAAAPSGSAEEGQ